MQKYALIEDGVVKQIFCTDDDIKEVFNTEEFNWVNISDVNSTVEVGYNYKSDKFVKETPPTLKFTDDEIESFRLIAYSNPLTGSDRYFSEALSLEYSDEPDKKKIQEAKAKGFKRQQEIKELYPFSET